MLPWWDIVIAISLAAEVKTYGRNNIVLGFFAVLLPSYWLTAKLLIPISPFFLLYVFKIAKGLFKGRGEKVKFAWDPQICFSCS
jgi:hypothetical protein